MSKKATFNKKQAIKPTYGDKYKLIAPEELKLNEAYTITINPKGDSDDAIYKSLLRLCRIISLFAEINVYLEYSVKMRLHAHGTIKLKDYANIYPLYANLWNKYTLYNIEIDSISDADEWNAYILKSSHLMEPYARKVNWIYNINNNTLEEAETKFADINELLSKSGAKAPRKLHKNRLM